MLIKNYYDLQYYILLLFIIFNWLKLFLSLYRLNHAVNNSQSTHSLLITKLSLCNTRSFYPIYTKQKVQIRAVKLNNKPNEMLIASPKGSVPVLVINEEFILHESLDIMMWALEHTNSQLLLKHDTAQDKAMLLTLIEDFDAQFIPALEAYCCAKRYHEDNLENFRHACETHLQQLEIRLSMHTFLLSNNESLLDIALFPFIRKFARVERKWYLQSPYPMLRQWLDNYLQSPTFTKVMAKHELWQENNKVIYFAG